MNYTIFTPMAVEGHFSIVVN